MADKIAKLPAFVRTAFGYTLLLVIFIGAWHIGSFLFSIASGVLSRVHVPPAIVSVTQDFIKTEVTPQIPVWITAIATFFLWRATDALTKATQAQVAIVAPLLEISLSNDDPKLPGTEITNHEDSYNDGWRTEDDNNSQLRPFIEGQSPCYVRIKITNAQPNVYGIAGKIQGKVALAFGAKDDTNPHPFTLIRVFTVPVIAGGKYVEGPILNIGTLPNFVAVVNEIQYADIQNRERKAAYGAGRLWKRLKGGPMLISQIYEPGKRELG